MRSAVRRTRLLLGGVAGALLVAGCVGASAVGPATVVGDGTRAVPDAGTVPPGPATAGGGGPAGGDATVGAVFVGADTQHVCSASVVATPARDVVVTAAHCVEGSGTDVSFSPGYRDGVEPFGRWQVVAAYAGASWLHGQDPGADVAFLVVAARDGRRLQDVVGGNVLGATPAGGTPVIVVGYPAGSHDAPIVCTAPLTVMSAYPALVCHGYVSGTSGAPFLTGTGATRTVVGVIGGLHQGGCEDYVSYSSPFGAGTAQLLARAAAHAHPDVLPVPGADGC